MNPRFPLRYLINQRRLSSFAAMAALIFSLGLTTSCTRQEVTATLFEDVTAKSGLDGYVGMTHGAAWGDFDGDGLPDLYLTNHLNEAKLYRNLGNGHFADVTSTFLSPKDLGGDKHGAVWADFDNDGRLDLVQLTGAARGVGTELKRLLVNRGARFEDVAEAAGISNPYGRTRMPLWFDFNNDGRLDLFQGAEGRFDDQVPPFFFLQQDGHFTASDKVLSFAGRSAPFCVITQLTTDNHPNLVCRLVGKGHALQVFDASTQPARELDLLPQTGFDDIAAGDFDNDGRIDLFLTRKNAPGPVAFGPFDAKELIADVHIDKSNAGKPAGFSFRARGQVMLQVASTFPGGAITAERIHIGKQGSHPDKMVFSLSADTAGIVGTIAYQPNAQPGVYVGMTDSGKWQVMVSAPAEAVMGGKGTYQQVTVRVTSSEAITAPEAVGDPIKAEEAPARLFMNRGGKLVEESDKRGVNKRLAAGMNVVSGDFDNDMHLDLFVVASGDIGKQENLLLLNRGDGHFDVVRNAGGAAGTTVGVGDSVTAADFDRDGFLDLLVSTGGSMGRSLGLASDGGGYHLYHNLRNGNHWIEMDLEGISSNRDGIGARVEVTAGGITQVRIQDGGVHERSQNHARLHFGLAKHTQVDKIMVHWPSGTVQELRGVKADQLLRIKESLSPGPSPASGRGEKTTVN